MSLILLDNLEIRAHAQHLKEEFIKVLYAGMLARELAGKAQMRDVEEAFIGAMLHNLGRMLAMFYFPGETEAVGRLVEAEGLSDAKASAQVLGLSFENLGIGIARSWGFPDQLVQSMKILPEGKVRKCTNNLDQLRVLAGFSNALCELVLDTPDADRTRALAKLTTRFGDSLPMTDKQLSGAMEKSMQDITQFARVVNVNLKHSPFARQASKWAGIAAPVAEPVVPLPLETDALQDGESVIQTLLGDSVLHEHASIPDVQAGEDGSKPQRSSGEIQSILISGLQDVSNSLIDDTISINDILRIILEAMYTGMGFAHVVLCIKDGRHNTMCGKFGFGDGVQSLIRAFDFPLAAQPDVFLAALQNNADILITDIDDPKIAARIPAWYRQHVPARTFVLFPIIVKGKPVGLIYADRPHPGDITIPEKELSLLKSLRNQAVLAIRQSL